MADNPPKWSTKDSSNNPSTEIWCLVGSEPRITQEAKTIAEKLPQSCEDEVSIVAIAFEGTESETNLKCSESSENVLIETSDKASKFSEGAAGNTSRVEAITQLAEDRGMPAIILFPHTPDTADTAPRLAKSLNGGYGTDGLIRVKDGDIVFGTSVYDGRALAEFEFLKRPIVCTLSQKIINTHPAPSGSTGIDTFSVDLDQLFLKFSHESKGISETPTERIRRFGEYEVPEDDLSLAKTIVAGGAGLDGPGGFELIEDLAESVGGAVGASRPPVDDGWVDFDRQIGVTGKEIDVDLYIPCAISGDPYHMRGVDADLLLAINNDPEAPIFSGADFGIIGDVYEYVPAFVEAIKTTKNGEEQDNPHRETRNSSPSGTTGDQGGREAE